MAKVSSNVVLHGASGQIGRQIVVHQTDHGIVLGVMPGSRPDAKVTPKQLTWREQFAHAVGYAKGAKDRPEYKPLAASRHYSTFCVATADFLHPPEIVDVDLSHYNGKAGDPIQVRAIDDVQVTEVSLAILTDQSVLVDKGALKRDPIDKTLWHFEASKDAGVVHVKLIVDAADLPGHIAQKLADKALA
jgi:hypothetical protein